MTANRHQLQGLNAGAVLADPAWSFVVRSPKGEGRSASQHYACMTLNAIAALPVAEWAAPDAWLFLWTTTPMLPQWPGWVAVGDELQQFTPVTPPPPVVPIAPGITLAERIEAGEWSDA